MCWCFILTLKTMCWFSCGFWGKFCKTTQRSGCYVFFSVKVMAATDGDTTQITLWVPWQSWENTYAGTDGSTCTQEWMRLEVQQLCRTLASRTWGLKAPPAKNTWQKCVRFSDSKHDAWCCKKWGQESRVSWSRNTGFTECITGDRGSG